MIFKKINNKIKMKTLTATLAIVFVVSIIIGSAVLGAETSVTATVTAEVIALSITANSSINYGAVSTTADTTSSGKNVSPTVQNDGSVNEDFQLKGTNSANWTLAGAAGDAIYAHKECHANCDSAPTWVALSSGSYTSNIFSAVAPAASNSFDLQITVPTLNAGVTQQNVNVFVQATKS